jgi:hypothetical protein
MVISENMAKLSDGDKQDKLDAELEAQATSAACSRAEARWKRPAGGCAPLRCFGRRFGGEFAPGSEPAWSGV